MFDDQSLHTVESLRRGLYSMVLLYCISFNYLAPLLAELVYLAMLLYIARSAHYIGSKPNLAGFEKTQTFHQIYVKMSVGFQKKLRKNVCYTYSYLKLIFFPDFFQNNLEWAPLSKRRRIGIRQT